MFSEAEYVTWTWVSILVGFPGVAFGVWNAMTEEHKPPPEFHDFAHMRVRSKVGSISYEFYVLLFSDIEIK